jgi:uncharacterized protein YllA (UPF0747 family)
MRVETLANEPLMGSIVRLLGYTIIFDKTKNVFVKSREVRATIMDLAESGYIVNFIPDDVNIADLIYKYDNEKKLIMTDEKSFTLDINEFGISR